MKSLTDAVADALMDAGQMALLLELLVDTTPDRAYQIGTKLGGHLGFGMIYYAEAFKMHNLMNFCHQVNADVTSDIKSGFIRESNKAAECFRKLGLTVKDDWS